jgi:hypothetical protein
MGKDKAHEPKHAGGGDAQERADVINSLPTYPCQHTSYGIGPNGQSVCLGCGRAA